jgi:hypothetical protein
MPRLRSQFIRRPGGGHQAGPGTVRLRHQAAIATLVLTAASLAAQAALPAGAAVNPASPAAPPSVTQASVTRALAATRVMIERQQTAAAALRREADAQPAPPPRTGGYLVTPAVFRLLTSGLGLNLSSPMLTGRQTIRQGTGGPDTILTFTAAAPDLGTLLPRGVTPPALPPATVTVDERAGTLTVAAASPGASLSATIAHAATTTLAAGADLTSRVTVHGRALGMPVQLAGILSAAGGTARLSLSGTTPGAVRLAGGQVLLAAGGTVTAVTGKGLHLSGTALLGPAGHQVKVAVDGGIADPRDWTLGVTTLLGGTPLPGLALAPGLTGAVTDDRGVVSYDVRGAQAGPWQPDAAATFDGARVEFADRLPADGTVTAPGATAGTPWAAVTGPLRLADGDAGTLTATGSAAANLATGAALLSGTQRGMALLASPSAPGQSLLAQPSQTLRDTGFRGMLRIGATGFTGTVRGTGIDTLQPPGGPAVPADTAFAAAPPAVTARPAAPAAQRALAVPGLARPAMLALALQAGSCTATGSYTLSSAVYGFLARTLHVPLAGPTVTGARCGRTITVTVGPLGRLPLAGGVTTATFGAATITIDTAAKTLLLTAAASGGHLAGTLTVTVGNPGHATLSGGTGVSGTLTLHGLPFFGGATVSLTGALGYAGGALTVSVTGTTDSAASFADGTVVITAGAVVTLAKSSPFTVSGTADIGPAGDSFGVHVDGSLSTLRTWSLTVSDASEQVWQPLPSLSLAPDFSGTVTDNSGTVRFSLTAGQAGQAGSPLLAWQPDAASHGLTVALTALRVSNAAPAASYHCGTDVAAGQVWIGATGSLTDTDVKLSSLAAAACVDVASRHFTIATTATGTPGGGLFGTATGAFSLTRVGLTATYDGKRFLLAGTARLTVDQPTRFTVSLGLALGSDGTLIGEATLASPAVKTGAGNSVPALPGQAGYIFLSDKEITTFNPASYGLPGAPAFPASVPLHQGVTVAYAGPLPGEIAAGLSELKISLPASFTVFVAASLSLQGFAFDIDADFGQRTAGVRLFDTNGTAVYFNDIDFGLKVSGYTSISVSGDAYLTLPPLFPSSGPSSVSVTVGGSLDEFGRVQVSLLLQNWETDAFGIQGMTVRRFGFSLGIIPDGEVTVGLSADKVGFPDSWDNAIGLADGALVTLDVNFDPSNPLFDFAIKPPVPPPGQSAQPVLYPLAVAYGGIEQGLERDPQVVKSVTVRKASLYVVPMGGATTAGNMTLQQGINVAFGASIAGHYVSVHGAVGTTPPAITVNVRADPVALGQLSLGGTHFYLKAGTLDDPKVSLGFTGSVAAGPADGSGPNFSLSANLHLAAGSASMNDAGLDLAVDTGLPPFLSAAGELTAVVAEDNGQVSFLAHGTGNFVFTVPPIIGDGTRALGGVDFYLSQDSGSFNWWTNDQLSQIAAFFETAPGGYNTVVTIFKHLGLNYFQILNQLGISGVTGQQVLGSLETGFGLFNPDYRAIWVDPSRDDLLVFPVIAVADASTVPGHRVIDWQWQFGYEQEWRFVAVPGTGSYEIVNRNSGQCLTVPGGPGSTAAATPGASVVQEPCAFLSTQYWNLGTSDGTPQQGPRFTIQNVDSQLYLDIQGASPNFGTIVDQWYSNGGMNQYFWLTVPTN